MRVVLTVFWLELIHRLDGPMSFRVYMQPFMASCFAIWDGVKDARAGKPPYLRSLLTDPVNRRETLRDGWKSIGKVAIMAMVLDLVYQVIVLHAVRPVEDLVVAVVLALVPYLVFRGPARRLARRFVHTEKNRAVA